MSDTASASMLKDLLDRLPGAVFCARRNPTTGEARWLYLSSQAAELYDLPEAELRADPNALLSRVAQEDVAQLQQLIAHSDQTGAPLTWVGKMVRRNGETRWVEMYAQLSRDAEGMMLWYGQSLDVTERKKTEQSLVESEAARARSEALYRQVIDALPVGVGVLSQAWEPVLMNKEQMRMMGGVVENDGDLAKAYGIFKADGVTPLPMNESGGVRCLRGEALEEEVVIRNPRLAGDVRMRTVWTPIHDDRGGVMALGTMQDITMQRQLELDLRARNEALAASEAAKAKLIERMRYSIDELSTPILQVWDDVLALPLIGVIDSQRASDMVQRLLAEVSRTQASFVIIDLTGVEIVDTKTADHLMKLMRKVEVVGARCVLTGIRPAVAETLVDIGVDFGTLVTLRNLKQGLREALRHARREREWMSELDADDRDGPAHPKPRG